MRHQRHITFALVAAAILHTALISAKCQEEPVFKMNTAFAIVDVWPAGKMPGLGAAAAEADMPAKPDGFKRITNISRPTLTIFRATGKKAPAVIVCPGGGYNYVVYDKEGTEVAAWLNSP